MYYVYTCNYICKHIGKFVGVGWHVVGVQRIYIYMYYVYARNYICKYIGQFVGVGWHAAGVNAPIPVYTLHTELHVIKYVMIS